jgi:hypothetical protein
VGTMVVQGAPDPVGHHVQDQGCEGTAVLEECYVFWIIHLDNALYTFADDTALGSDQVGPRFVKNIPLEARMQLLAFYNKCFRSVMWP